MKAGDLVKWTFAKVSVLINKENKFQYAILLEKCVAPYLSWIILLDDGTRIHATTEELELIRACR